MPFSDKWRAARPPAKTNDQLLLPYWTLKHFQSVDPAQFFKAAVLSRLPQSREIWSDTLPNLSGVLGHSLQTFCCTAALKIASATRHTRSQEQWLRCLLELQVAVSLNHVPLACHSGGGMTSWLYCHKHPNYRWSLMEQRLLYSLLRMGVCEAWEAHPTHWRPFVEGCPHQYFGVWLLCVKFSGPQAAKKFNLKKKGEKCSLSVFY